MIVVELGFQALLPKPFPKAFSQIAVAKIHRAHAAMPSNTTASITASGESP
jgi:hypothetical protein